MFGIELDTPRGAAQFLSICTRVLSDPRRVLWITAQGEFADPRQRPLRLRPGIAHLLRRFPDAVVLPLAMEYTFWNEAKPEALARFGPPIAARDRSAASPSGPRLLEDELTRTHGRAGGGEPAPRSPPVPAADAGAASASSPFYNVLPAGPRRWPRGRTIDVSHGGRE